MRPRREPKSLVSSIDCYHVLARLREPEIWRVGAKFQQKVAACTALSASGIAAHLHNFPQLFWFKLNAHLKTCCQKTLTLFQIYKPEFNQILMCFITDKWCCGRHTVLNQSFTKLSYVLFLLWPIYLSSTKLHISLVPDNRWLQTYFIRVPPSSTWV